MPSLAVGIELWANTDKLNNRRQNRIKIEDLLLNVLKYAPPPPLLLLYNAQLDAGVNCSLKDFEDVKIVIRHILAQTHRPSYTDTNSLFFCSVWGIILIIMQPLSGGGGGNIIFLPPKLAEKN